MWHYKAGLSQENSLRALPASLFTVNVNKEYTFAGRPDKKTKQNPKNVGLLSAGESIVKC